MAHEEHLAAVPDELHQGVGHDTGFDLGALFQLLAAAAVELKGGLGLDNGLVATTGQGHVDAQGRILVQFLQGALAFAHADGQRGAEALAVLHLMDGLQNGELARGELQQAMLLKNKQIPVPLQAADDALGGLGPVVDVPVDVGGKGGFFRLAGVFHQLLIAVDDDESHRRAGALHIVPQTAVFGDIHPEQRGQQGAATAAARPHHVAIDLVFLLAQLHIIGAKGLALHDPAGVKAVEHIGDVGLEQRVLFTADLGEIIVAPDDLAGVHPQDRHGQRKIDHGMLGGVVHGKRQIFHIFADLGGAALGALPVIKIEQSHQHQLRQACGPVDLDPGDRRKQQHHHKGQARA